ncbi:MAG: hypothetical protein K6F93_00475 [Lachnospiraceae bacterium]|nr:hypothetical protein [Lachnospiraceae bacterium]
MKKRGVIFIALLICAIAVLAPMGNDGGDQDGTTAYVSAIAATTTPTVSPTATPTPTPKPQFLVATYSGGSVLVGENYDEKKLEVVLYYDDGSTEKLDSYATSGRKVTTDGDNKYVVIYKGLTTEFYVTGKTVIGVSATVNRYTYTVGNGPDTRDLTVILEYSDGSTETTEDYVVSPATVSRQGNQELTVVSHGRTSKVTVWGEQIKTMRSLSVSWDANYKPITDEIIQKKDISVIAVYSDYSTERITSYEIVTQRFSNAGENELKVAFRGLTATTKLEVQARIATDIRAEYKGSALYVGDAPAKKDIEVYVKFNNGREIKVDDYTMLPEAIEYPGDNRIRITYDKVGTDIYVKGVEEPEPDFEKASSIELDSDYGSFSVAAAVPKRLEGEELLEVKTLKKSKVKKLMKKLKVSGDYIPFEVEFIDEDNESELPLPLRVTVPDEFDIEYTYLYYSSNVRKQGCRLGIVVDKENNCIQPELFCKVGTYILVCDPTVDMTEDEREEYLEKRSNE